MQTKGRKGNESRLAGDTNRMPQRHLGQETNTSGKRKRNEINTKLEGTARIAETSAIRIQVRPPQTSLKERAKR